METRRSDWIPEIDGLRAFAAFAVILAHFAPASQPLSLDLLMAAKQFSPGNLGVVLFFALSAFLLTLIGLREFDRTDGILVRQFYLRRIFRIWPLYYTALALIFVFIMPWGPFGPAYGTGEAQIANLQANGWTYLVFLSNWDAFRFDRLAWVNELALLWTIATEEQFYLVFPLALGAALRSVRARVILLVLCIGSAWIWRLTFALLFPSHWTPYYTTVTYLDVFASGAVAAWLCVRGHARWSSHPLVGLGALAGLIVIGYLGDRIRTNMWDLTDAWPNPIYFGLVGPLSALLLACVYQNRGSRWLAWLRSDVLRTLGVLSYGTYAWHMAGGRMVNIRLASAPAEPVLLLQIAVLIWYLGLVIGTAAMTYRFVERPALQLKDRWFGGHHRSSSGWSARWLPALLISVGAVCIAEAVFRLI